MDLRWQVVAYLLASILLRLVIARLTAGRTGHAGWANRLMSNWPAAPLRFAYYVGLPYVTLVLGVLPSRYLGLVGLDRLPAIADAPAAATLLAQVRAALSLLLLMWLPDIGRMAGLTALMGLLLVVTWLACRHALRSLRGTCSAEPARYDIVDLASFSRSAYAAVHWSFYRACVWLLTGDLYLGIVGGVILVYGEWLICNWWSRPASDSTSPELRLVDASVLATTSTIFYFVPNLWLLVPIHWLLALVGRRILQPVYVNRGPAQGQPATRASQAPGQCA
jgi:hypothetical protein